MAMFVSSKQQKQSTLWPSTMSQSFSFTLSQQARSWAVGLSRGRGFSTDQVMSKTSALQKDTKTKKTTT